MTNQQMLDAYIAAELAVLKGQSYSVDGETLNRADLDKIRAGRREYERRVAAENRIKLSKKRHRTASF